jgi:hypothetical protein
MYIFIIISFLLLYKFLIINSKSNCKKGLIKPPSDSNLSSLNISIKNKKIKNKIVYSKILLERETKVSLDNSKSNIIFYITNSILLYENLSYEDKSLVDFILSLCY